MTDFHMTIDGRPVAGPDWFDVLNPATERVFGRAPDCAPAQLDTAMAAAAAAFPAWRADAGARRAALLACADVLVGEADSLAAVLTAEQGKPLANARGEIVRSADWFRYFAGIELAPEVLQDDSAAHVSLVRRPIGVVAAITPWNFPLMLACWKLAPALAAGNTVVLKPSPYTPLTTLAMGALLARVLPPGVLGVISGGDRLGRAMTAHPAVRKISFTGSTAAGKAVAASAAPDLKRVTLELGGNDPAIVLDDADVGRIAGPLFWRAFANNGQICSAIKRIYVPERLHDSLVDAMAAIAAEVKVGEGTQAGVQLGPINNAAQRDRVRSLVSEAQAGGARTAAGGQASEGPGYFYRPTILCDLPDDARIVDEEQFGPALPIIAYTNLDEAVTRANHGHFGLGGSVWSDDAARAEAVGEALDCGTTWVNDHLPAAPHLPMSGHKWSGLGAENGMLGLHGFTETQVRYRARA